MIYCVVGVDSLKQLLLGNASCLKLGLSTLCYPAIMLSCSALLCEIKNKNNKQTKGGEGARESERETRVFVCLCVCVCERHVGGGLQKKYRQKNISDFRRWKNRSPRKHVVVGGHHRGARGLKVGRGGITVGEVHTDTHTHTYIHVDNMHS